MAYECPGGHLVVGPVDPDHPQCPACYRPPGPRWKMDPYVMYHADMLYERGMLKGDELNSVQIALLSSVIVRKRERERQRRLVEFEEALFVSDPARYKAYEEYKKRQEAHAEWEEGVEWRTPQSLEEARAISAAFAEATRELGDEEEEVLDVPADVDEDDWVSFLDDDDLAQMKD